MTKVKKIMSILLTLVLCFTMLPINALAERESINVDLSGANPSTSTTHEGDRYYNDSMGIRISIYYAPRAPGEKYTDWEDYFSKPDRVKQIGKTTDFIGKYADDDVQKGAPFYGVDIYSNKSVYDYMIDDDDTKATKNEVYKKYTPVVNGGTTKYHFVKETATNIVSTMPNPRTATTAQWTEWFNSPQKDSQGNIKKDSAGNPINDYTNIPRLIELCGGGITYSIAKLVGWSTAKGVPLLTKLPTDNTRS